MIAKRGCRPDPAQSHRSGWLRIDLPTGSPSQVGLNQCQRSRLLSAHLQRLSHRSCACSVTHPKPKGKPKQHQPQTGGHYELHQYETSSISHQMRHGLHLELLKTHGHIAESIRSFRLMTSARECWRRGRLNVWIDRLLNSSNVELDRSMGSARPAFPRRRHPDGGINRSIDKLHVNTPERSPLACHR